MANHKFTFGSYFVRFLISVVLVLVTFNPLQPYSYFYWALQPLLSEITDFSILKALAGIILIIGWTIFIRATLVSLGVLGTLLVVAFFGLLGWFVVDQGWINLDGGSAFAWLVLIGLSGVLSFGLSWSLIRRRMTGQYDVDDADV